MVETRPWPIPSAPTDGPLVHHVSDTHAGYRGWSYAEMDHMLHDLQQGLIPPVDLFVHTGDIIDGTINTTSYTVAQEDAYVLPWLTNAAKGVPSLWAVGNHDLRDRAPDYSRANWEAAYGRPANTFIDVRGYRFVTFTVDTFLVDVDPTWIIPTATWEWLDEVCGSAPGPVVLCSHFPPVELTASAYDHIEPVSALGSLIAAHPAIVGMLCGHMHKNLDDPALASFQTVGGRLLPVVCDVSSMLSLNGLSRDQSAQLQSLSAYIGMRPDRWEVRFRAHGTRAWCGQNGQRVTTMDLAAGTITHGMG